RTRPPPVSALFPYTTLFRSLWGGVHGVGLCLTRMFRWRFGEPARLPLYRIVAGWFATFITVMLARIFFRAPSMATAYAVLGGMVDRKSTRLNSSHVASSYAV